MEQATHTKAARDIIARVSASMTPVQYATWKQERSPR